MAQGMSSAGQRQPGVCGIQGLQGVAMGRSDEKTNESAPARGLNLPELIPDLFGRYFAFFRPGHEDGVVPTRVKELARLKIAALNDCDT